MAYLQLQQERQQQQQREQEQPNDRHEPQIARVGPDLYAVHDFYWGKVYEGTWDGCHQELCCLRTGVKAEGRGQVPGPETSGGASNGDATHQAGVHYPGVLVANERNSDAEIGPGSLVYYAQVMCDRYGLDYMRAMGAELDRRAQPRNCCRERKSIR